MQYFTFMTVFFFSFTLFAQSELGEGVYACANDDTHQLLILVDGYASLTVYQDEHYISATGGPYNVESNQIVVDVEFDDQNPESVGSTRTYSFTASPEGFIDQAGNNWIPQEKIKTELDGAWTIKGRYSDGEYHEIEHTGSRKTMKLLKDGHFQWIAMHPGEQQMYGTGGGVYTVEDDTYTEHILFFSRDDARVGATLEFTGKIIDGDWHHSGVSSRGEPLHEVWVKE